MAEAAIGEVILGALRARRSVGKVHAHTVPRAAIEQVIEAATWAPNHRLTAPWRFTVVSGASRSALGEVMAQSLLERLHGTDQARATAQIEKERAKPLRAPVVIAVAAEISPEPGVVAIEEIAAVAAGIQNMLLAAEALGLGAIWRTGEAASDPAVKRFLGFAPDSQLLALIYLGYPEETSARERADAGGTHITWME